MCATPDENPKDYMQLLNHSVFRDLSTLYACMPAVHNPPFPGANLWSTYLSILVLIRVQRNSEQV